MQEVARRASVSRPALWRAGKRDTPKQGVEGLLREQGVEGLLRDGTRKPGRAPLSTKVVAKVMDLTCSEPPGHATHWTGHAMAKAVGVSLRAVQRLWRGASTATATALRTFKRSNDPEFAEKVERHRPGLYMDPPKHTVVVSIEKESKSRRSTACNRASRRSSPENAGR